jgi:putative Ca2+/H+ antiporter (TMEM165/GDT1 family)
MDWKLFVSTFTAIFLAEMGDKTQIAAFALAGSGSSRWVVFAAASLALVATTAVAVAAGAAVGKYVPAIWLKRAAGATFVILGVLFLLSRPDTPAANGDPTPPAQSTPASN